MKRLDVVNAKLKKLYDILFDVNNSQDANKPSEKDIESAKEEIRKYEREKTVLYLREFNKLIKQMPWLLENEVYKNIMTHNAEFDFLFLQLINKCPNLINDNNLLMPIVNFVNTGTKKYDKVRELLALNRNVLSDSKLLNRINDKCYPQIKEILKSFTLMSSQKFREYLANLNVLGDKEYNNVRLMERAFKEGLDLDLVMALGNDAQAKDYLTINMSKDLLDHINKAKTKTLKKQILSIMYDCDNDKILNILVRFFDIEIIRDQLLDENSFYYKLLIKPISRGITPDKYASTDEVISTCSKGFDNYILACDNTDILAHSFDCITGPYIYYFRDGKVHSIPVSKFTNSFNSKIDKFHQAFDIINVLPNSSDQEYLNTKYEKYLNDDLRVIAKSAILDNEDVKLSEEEISEWNNYIEETYGTDFDEEYDVIIGYGLDSFDEIYPKNLNYSYNWNVIPKSMVG